jgi:hypothetical protein
MKELDQFVAEEEKTEAVSEENADELDEGKEKITKDEITEKKEVKKD